ncbi:synaptotagmin-16 isoform X2 [Anoplophora glabripennis]|uniref:synaptotagmin-16 isoform X2 n=1 Tax=Anoplophora glabripennis TaxID=217634 RepID=UPI0008742A21|nr:synaptotagmin-16 isoform X2 [Anoplophora glabripennis]
MVMVSEHGYIGGANGGTMLGAFAGLGAILLVFLLYIKNKGWWWSPVRGMSCCDEACPPVSSRPVPTPSVPNCSSITPGSPKTKLVKAYSFDGGESSSESEMGGSRPRQNSGVPLGTTGPYYPPRPVHDLISLVEKGRVGMSSNSSCCSSTTSSVGEKHGVPATKVTAQIVENVQRSPTDLRETKIDNQGIDYQKVDTSAQIEQTDNNSNRDCIVVMNTENEERGEVMSCGGGSDPETQIVSKCGHLEVALLYDAPMRKMTVHVLQARDIPSRDRGQPTHTQVRLILLPSKKQKHKTKIRSGENPQYMESFLLHRVNPEDVNSMGIRLRLYGCERMRRERLIGEAVVSFANINLELENNFWLNLEPRANTALSGCTGDLMSLARSDSTGSTHSMQHGGVPELLLGLCYNATTGRLNVEVVKGSHFRNLALTRAPDTYVKLNLVSSTGQELAHSKTTVRRGQPNPLFKETFIFQVALFQLADVTLMVAVYNRKGVTKKKEMVGWFSLGLNSSGAEELAHWMDMKEFQQEQICRWHILVQS